jgi:hypothetical protein
MSEAPERIFASPPHDDHEWSSGSGEWDVSDGWAVEPLVEYIRADKVQALVDAARPFRAAVFNDNGDVTISTGHITTRDWLRLDAALAALDAKP